MARLSSKEEAPKKAQEPYLNFLVEGKWAGKIAGVCPVRSTMADHLAHVLEDEEARLRRKAAKAKPSDAQLVTNGDEEIQLSQRAEWLRKALVDPSLDVDARKTIMEALRECTPDELLVRTINRATTTFRVAPNGNLAVPIGWFYGALKAALTADGMYEDAAGKLVKRCVSILPPLIDLGTTEPDCVVEANVTLGSNKPGEAQASIKRFHVVSPAAHDKGNFSVVFKVLDSPMAKPITDNMKRIAAIIGTAGLGGGRPQMGNFIVVDVSQLEPEEAAEVIATLG